MRRTRVDESPMSAFVREMKAAFVKRLEAHGINEKRAVEREVEAIMRRHLGRNAWDAAAACDQAQANVPRATSQPQVSSVVDRKLASVGRESD